MNADSDPPVSVAALAFSIPCSIRPVAPPKPIDRTFMRSTSCAAVLRSLFSRRLRRPHYPHPTGDLLARPNYSQQKKQREAAARKKRDEKQQRRQQKKDDAPATTSN